MTTLSFPSVLPTALIALVHTSWLVSATEAVLSAVGVLFLADATIDPEMGAEV